jgi:hypothetical protein
MGWKSRGTHGILLLALLACSCHAQRPAQSSADAPQSGGGPAGPDDKLVCRREEVVGSHMKQRVCMYESERKRENEAAQDVIRNNRSGLTDPGKDNSR